jgi:protein-tyrosine phosphatase
MWNRPPTRDVIGQDGPVPARPRPFVVTFVCSGNICRSPIAQVVLTELVRRRGLDEHVHVDSAGIGDWHVGERADPRAIAVLRDHGYDGSAHRARQLDPRELATADLVVAMDDGHAGVLRAFGRTPADKAKVRLLRSFDPAAGDDLDVADPYYGEDVGFTTVIEQVKAAAPGLVDYVRKRLNGDGPAGSVAPTAT